MPRIDKAIALPLPESSSSGGVGTSLPTFRRLAAVLQLRSHCGLRSYIDRVPKPISVLWPGKASSEWSRPSGFLFLTNQEASSSPPPHDTDGTGTRCNQSSFPSIERILRKFSFDS